MRKTTIVKEDRNNISEDRDFFCSELVAKAFKILGIMVDDDVACTQYMPGSFSDEGRGSLKLTEGTSMESDKVIIIELDDSDVARQPIHKLMKAKTGNPKTDYRLEKALD